CGHCRRPLPRRPGAVRRAVRSPAAAGKPAARLYNESEMAVQKLRELRLRQRADLGLDDLAVAEQHQRGNAANAVLARDRLVFVDVDLDDPQLAAVVAGDLV